jgi:hypothetical protein
MAYVISPDNRTTGEGNPAADEDDNADMIGLLSCVLAGLGGITATADPGGNAANVAVLQAMKAAGFTRTGLPPTGTDDTANITSALASSGRAQLIPGETYYVSTPLEPGPYEVIEGNGATLQPATGGFTGSALVKPNGSYGRISDLIVNTTGQGFLDLGNVFTYKLKLEKVTATCNPPSGAGSGAPLVTGLNLHQAGWEDCTFTQNDPDNTALEIGSGGSGLSEMTFTRCRCFGACLPGPAPAGTRTKPTVSIITGGAENVDVIKFIACYIQGIPTSGCATTNQYQLDIQYTGGSPTNYFDGIYVDCDFGDAPGGGLRLLGCQGAEIRARFGNTIVGGMGAQQDLICLGSGPGGGAPAVGISVTLTREGGGVPHGTTGSPTPSDVGVSGAASQIKLSNLTATQGAAGIQVNLNNDGSSGPAANVLIENPQPNWNLIGGPNTTAGEQTIVTGLGAVTVGGTALT